MPPLKLDKELLHNSKGHGNEQLLNPVFDSNSLDIVTCLKQYRQFTMNLAAAYKNYLNEITGGAQNPEEYAKEQMKEVQKILDSAPNGFNISKVINAHDLFTRLMNPEELQKLSQANLFGEDFFKVVIEYLAPRAKIMGDIEKTGLDPQTQNFVRRALFAYAPQYKDLGVTEQTMKRLNAMGDRICSIDALLNRINVIDADENVQQIIEKSNAINERMRQYLITGNEALIPTDDEFLEYLTTITDEISRRPIFQEGDYKLDDLRMGLIDLVGAIGDMCPAHKVTADAVKVSQEKRAKHEAFKLLDNAASTSISNDEKALEDFRLSYERIEGLYNDGMFEDSDMDRLRMIRMIRDPKFRENEKQRAMKAIESFAQTAQYNLTHDVKKDPAGNAYGFRTLDRHSKNDNLQQRNPQDVFAEAYKLYFQVLFVEDEAAKAELYNQSPDMAGKTKSGSSAAMAQLFSGEAVNNQMKAEIDKLLDKFNSNSEIAPMLAVSPGDFDLKIKNQNIVLESIAKDTLYNFDNIKIKIDDDTVNALCQEGKNSESYSDIARSINAFNTSTHNGESNIEDAKDLYNKLKTYVQNHDSKPFYDNGKLRFDKASILMGQLGDALCEKDPGLTEDINKDINILMLRSKTFRDSYIKMQQSNLDHIIGKGNKLTPALIESQTPENKEMIKSISDKLSFGIMAGNILTQKTKYGHVTGKLSVANQEKLLQQYGGLLNYSKDLFTDKVSYTAERHAIANLLNDNTKNDIKLDIQRNVAKMLLRKKCKEKVFSNPKTIKEISALNQAYADIEDNRKLDQFIAGENFQIFFNSLGLNGVKALADDVKNTEVLLKGYDDIARLSPEEKLSVKCINNNKHTEEISGKFTLFFRNLSEHDKENFANVFAGRKVAYSSGRTAMHSLVAATMLADGFRMDEILDPYKLRNERDRYCNELLNKFKDSTVTDKDFVEYAQSKYLAGIQKTIDHIDSMLKGKVDTSLSYLTQDKFSDFAYISVMLNDMGQELEKYNKTNPILYKQVGLVNIIPCIFDDKWKLGQLAIGYKDPGEKHLLENMLKWAMNDKVMSDSLKNNNFGTNRKFSDVFNKGNLHWNFAVSSGMYLVDPEYIDPLAEQIRKDPNNVKAFAQKQLDDKLFKSEDIIVKDGKSFGGIKGYDKTISGINAPKNINTKNIDDYLKNRKSADNIVAVNISKSIIKELSSKADKMYRDAFAAKDKDQLIQSAAINQFMDSMRDPKADPQVVLSELSVSSRKNAINELFNNIKSATKDMSFDQVNETIKKGNVKDILAQPKQPEVQDLEIIN